MEIKNKKVVVFDFDGVFVDDFDFHKNHIEKFLDIEIDEKDFYDIHSGNVYEDDNVGLELGNFDVKQYCNSIRQEFVNLPIVEGMEKVARNAQEIADTFVVSSGCENNIRGFFANKNICDDFCTVYGVETNPSKKEKFEKILKGTSASVDDVIFVTDTLGDLNEANSLGIASIAVTWGFQRIETLEKGAPFGFAHEAEDVTKLVKEYF